MEGSTPREILKTLFGAQAGMVDVPRKVPSTVNPTRPRRRVVGDVFLIWARRNAAARCFGTIMWRRDMDGKSRWARAWRRLTVEVINVRRPGRW